MVRVKFESKISDSISYYYFSICYFDIFNVRGQLVLAVKVFEVRCNIINISELFL